jgi:hypothetical protein
MSVPNTVPVSVRALIQRINRKLAPEGEALRTTRRRWRSNLGDYYLVDLNRNFVTQQRVNLEALGRELGVLSPWEALVEEDAAPEPPAEEKKQASKRPGKVS